CTDVGYIYLSKLLVSGKPEELKRLPDVTPSGTRRYELELPEPAVRLRELRSIRGIKDATLFGDTIHVLADDSVDAERLRDELHLSKEVVHVRPIEATLEDVFVTLTRNA